MSIDPESLASANKNDSAEKTAGKRGTSALLMAGWFSVGMAVATIGIFVGVELRSRYKFSHRTPYDFYASAGERPVSEFGVGV